LQEIKITATEMTKAGRRCIFFIINLSKNSWLMLPIGVPAVGHDGSPRRTIC
jgi:hypothetical protein